MYSLLYEKMCTLNADAVKCKYVREAYPGKYVTSEDNRQDVEYTFPSRNGLYYGRVEECGNQGRYGSVCTGLYKRSIIAEHDLRFPEKLACEDNYFDAILSLYIGSLYILDKAMYHYFINPASTMMSTNAPHHLDRLKIELMLIDAFKERGAFEIWHDEIERDFLQRFYLNTWHIVFTKFTYIPDIFSFMKRSILQLFPEYKKNPYFYLMEQRNPILCLLEMDGELRPEELAMIREAYFE